MVLVGGRVRKGEGKRSGREREKVVWSRRQTGTRRQLLSRSGGRSHPDVPWVTASPGPVGQAPCNLDPSILPLGDVLSA